MNKILMKKILLKKIKKIFLIIFFLYGIKASKHYQKHKERLQKVARERYQSLSEEKKDKREEKGLRKISKCS